MTSEKVGRSAPAVNSTRSPGRRGVVEHQRTAWSTSGHRRLAGRPRPSGGPTMTADSQEQIRTLLEARTQAFASRDAATAAAAYDEDLVLYDAIGPFVRRGEHLDRSVGDVDRPVPHRYRPRDPGSGDHCRSRSRVLPLPGPDQRHRCGTKPRSPCGCTRRAASAGSGASGRSCTSTRRCPSTPTPARPQYVTNSDDPAFRSHDGGNGAGVFHRKTKGQGAETCASRLMWTWPREWSWAPSASTPCATPTDRPRRSWPPSRWSSPPTSSSKHWCGGASRATCPNRCGGRPCTCTS